MIVCSVSLGVEVSNLRKFFRKYANQAGFEFVQFWMGHIVKEGQDEHYRPKDVEFHRQLYAEKAMPYLRLETSTPSETDQTIMELKGELAKRDKEIQELKTKVGDLEFLKKEVERISKEQRKLNFETQFRKEYGETLLETYGGKPPTKEEWMRTFEIFEMVRKHKQKCEKSGRKK